MAAIDPRRAVSLAARGAAGALRVYAGLLRWTADLIEAPLGLVSGADAKPDLTRRSRSVVVDVTERPRARRTVPDPRPEPEPEPGPAPSRPPRHVSEEPVLAATVADPGAENGAGAELRIDEPWPGYDALSARDVVDRLAVASDSEIGIIQLYEQTHRGRRTVITAARQELRRRSATAG